MQSLVTFSPAKVNLFLAITDRRADGFHNLVSVVAQLDFGDLLWFKPGSSDGSFSLECDRPDVPLDEGNLILKAARLFRETLGSAAGGHFVLRKQIPMGAGLGGGSSNASAALRLLNAQAGWPLPEAELGRLAGKLGSDCPLFLHSGPIVMRGRGEQIECLPHATASRLAGRRLLLFRPPFGISTPWAYQQMASDPSTYLPASEAEKRVSGWLTHAGAPVEDLLFNNMETVAFRKYLAMPVLLDQVKLRFGLEARMSGSGSSCFVILPESFDAAPLRQLIHASWGDACFIKETRLR